MTLGEQLSNIRKRKGLKIETLSEMSGVPKGTLNKILNGVTADPQIETVRAIVKALGCTLNDLDSDTDKEIYSSPDKILLSKYHSLNEHGKSIVNIILDFELERMQSNVPENVNDDAPTEDFETFP